MLFKSYKIVPTALIFTIVFSLGTYVYNDIPLRTAIFRTVAKGNNYLISEKDTLYSFGYYGVRKWLTDSIGNMMLIAENDEFCKNRFIGRLMGRSGTIKGDYIYVVARSYLGGADEIEANDYLNGKIIVMHKKNLTVVQEINSDIKLIEAKIHKNNLVVSGLKGFDVYDITDASHIKPLYRYRHKKFTEFQGFEIFEHRDSTYIAFARFAEGVSIWNMTDRRNVYPVKNISIQSIYSENEKLPKGLQSFRVCLRFPYLYATLAPMSSYFGKVNDRRGIITFDLSNLDSIRNNVTLIPQEEYYTTKTGDCQPTHLDIYNNKLYVNFGEKGYIVFDLTNPFKPKMENIKNINNKHNVILPIHINHRGIMFSGNYYWSDLYKNPLN